MNKTIDQFDSSAEQEGKALQQAKKISSKKINRKRPQKIRTVNAKLLDKIWEEKSYLSNKDI